MKTRLQIFSGSFVMIFAFLQVQPVFISYEQKKENACEKIEAQSCTSGKSTTLARGKCSLPVSPGQEEDCNNNGCNPFVPCSIGFCCYLVESFYSYSTSFLDSNQKLHLFDDNRVASGLSECWHPPEMIS